MEPNAGPRDETTKRKEKEEGKLNNLAATRRPPKKNFGLNQQKQADASRFPITDEPLGFPAVGSALFSRRLHVASRVFCVCLRTDEQNREHNRHTDSADIVSEFPIDVTVRWLLSRMMRRRAFIIRTTHPKRRIFGFFFLKMAVIG